jgi:hypothetical protein
MELTFWERVLALDLRVVPVPSIQMYSATTDYFWSRLRKLEKYFTRDYSVDMGDEDDILIF